MPTQAPVECPKESYNWEVRKAQNPGHKFAWESTGNAGAVKNECAEWSRRVRSAYEVPRRILRVYRWCKRPRFGTNIIARLFREHAERWKEETGHLSSVTKMIAHPSYLRIIALAKYSTNYELERLLLNELAAEPDHWFDALTAITGENPVEPQYDFDQSVNAWIEWGHRKGII